jgi:PAS domain S-box-containing protein
MTRSASRSFLSRLLPAIVFLAGMALALVAWKMVDLQEQGRRRAVFGQEVERIVENMTRRLENNRNALRAGVGLFAASIEVDRAEWRQFVEGIEFEERYPGLLALGFVERIPAGELGRHEARIRAEGFPGYGIWPSRTAAEYLPVVFAEPCARVDTSYLGFDHASRPVPAAALAAATATRNAVLTGTMVLLLPDLDNAGAAPPRGLIMYKPVFRYGPRVALDAPYGFVVGWIRVDDLFRDLVSPLDAPHIDFDVYDGAGEDAAGLVFDFKHPGHSAAFLHGAVQTIRRPFEFAGKNWLLVFKKARLHDDAGGFFLSMAILAPGFLLALLLSFLTHRLLTARHRAQERADRMADRFEESEERFRSIVESIPGAVYRCANDAEFTMEYISDGIRAITGRSAVEFIGNLVRSYASVIHPEDLETMAREVDEAIAARRPFILNYRIIDASGRIRWVYEKGQGDFDAEGRLRHLDGVIFDTTERRELELQLVTAQKMDLLGRMVGGFAHDFNNIMMILRFHAERAVDPALDAANHEKSAEALKRALDRADGLARNLLAFSRKQSVSLVPCDLNALVRNALELMQPLLKKGCRLRLALDDAIAPVQADQNQFTQVLMNLVVNARDAMPRGGEIAIATGMETIAGERLHHHGRIPAGEYVRLEVADTGEGIGEEGLARIFEPFYTTKSAEKGSGLGLAVVYGVLSQHHAFILCESRLGKGTTFRIYFPKAE